MLTSKGFERYQRAVTSGNKSGNRPPHIQGVTENVTSCYQSAVTRKGAPDKGLKGLLPMLPLFCIYHHTRLYFKVMLWL